MILVDTSAWVEFLRGTGSPAHLRVRAALAEGEEIVSTEPVHLEVLAGASSPERERRLRRLLLSTNLRPVRSLDDWHAAAAIYLRCRAAGATVRSLQDCLVAAVALRCGLVVLAHDRDFRAIADATGLVLDPASLA